MSPATPSELIKVLSALKLRFDQQAESEYNLATFVPIVDFATLASPNTNVIYGRNGTGKTHLLRAFHEYCLNEYDSTRILPVYIDCKTLEFGNIGREVDVAHLVQRYYRLFVARVIDALSNFGKKALTPAWLERWFGGDTINKKKSIESSLSELRKIFSYEIIEQKVTTFKRRRQVQEENALNASLGTTIKLDLLDPKVGVEASLSASEKSKRSEAIEVISDGLAVIDYDSVRTLLEAIIESTGAVGIVILVDEWSSIDLDLQPIFAEIINKTLAVSKRIHLKIVALKYFTRFSAVIKPPQRIGLQTGIEIFSGSDLDHLLCFDIDGQAVKDFLTLVAYKHSCAISPGIQQIDAVTFEKRLCSELYESPNAYLEIVRASEGNPRDFLSLLAASCTIRLNRSKPLSEKDAEKIAIEHFATTKAPTIKDSGPVASKLYQKLFERVTKNGQKLFLISVEKAEESTPLRELLHFRFIHLVSSTFAALDDNHIPHTYALFSMDYGKLVSLKVTKTGEQIVRLMIYASELLGSSLVLGSSFASSPLTGYIKQALEGELGAKLIRVAGTNVAPTAAIRAGNISPEILVQKCVYDDLV
jgi:hypothetical protein